MMQNILVLAAILAFTGSPALGARRSSAPKECPPGSHVDGFGWCKACPRGTYQPLATSNDNRACRTCYPGHYCPAEGLSLPSGPCYPGFYCPGGNWGPTENTCPENHFCVAGSWVPTPCPQGLVSTVRSNSIHSCRLAQG